MLQHTNTLHNRRSGVQKNFFENDSPDLLLSCRNAKIVDGEDSSTNGSALTFADPRAAGAQRGRRSVEQRDHRTARHRRSAPTDGRPPRRRDRLGVASRPGRRPLLQRGGAEPAAVPAGAGAPDPTIVLVSRAVLPGSAGGT